MLLHVHGFSPRPFAHLNYSPVDPVEQYSSSRDYSYHLGRIIYFRNCFLRGEKVDPISIITREYEVILADGHHRVAGAILAGISFIEAKKENNLCV